MLSHRLDPTDVLDVESYAMLRRNELSSVISPQLIQHDEERELQYKTEDMHEAKSYLSTHVFNRTQYIAVLLSFTNAFIEAYEYMLPDTGLVGDLSYVFIDNNLGVHVPYAPIEGFVGNEGALEVLRSVEQLLEPDESSGEVDYAQTVREALTKWKSFKLPEFKRILCSLTLQPELASGQHDGTPRQVGPSERQNAHDARSRDRVREDERGAHEERRSREASNAAETPGMIHGDIVIPGSNMVIPGGNNAQPSSDAIADIDAKEHGAERKGLFDSFFARITREKPEEGHARVVSRFGDGDTHGDMAIPGRETPSDSHIDVPNEDAGELNESSRRQGDSVHNNAGRTSHGMRTMAYTYADDDEESVVIGHEVKERLPAEEGRMPTTDYSGKQPVTVGAYLIRQKTGTKQLVSVTPFYIGRLRSEVDFFIPDNKLVGRVHAAITFTDGQFYLVDKDSRNHTYLDGRQLEPNVPTPIRSGSVIVLSQTETLLFRVD